MSIMTVDLDTARWLKGQGFPQDQWHGEVRYAMVWVLYPDGNTEWELRPWGQDYSSTWEETGWLWVAAPHPVDALDWLGWEKGWPWMRTLSGHYWALAGNFSIMSDYGPHADTPTKLLAAIRSHMAAS